MFEFLYNVKNYVVSYWKSFWKYQVTDSSGSLPYDATAETPTDVSMNNSTASPDSHSEETSAPKRRRRRRKKPNTGISSQTIEHSNAPAPSGTELSEPETHSLLETVEAKKKNDVVSPRKRVVETDKSTLHKTTVSKPDDVKEQQIPSTVKETPTAAAITASSSTTFFPPATKNKSTAVASLQRSQLPKPMMDLIDKLRGQFPSARFFMTGAAPADILDKLKPNDYDLLVVDKSSIFEINQFLNLQNYKSEVRSFKYPVIFCEVDKELSLDFSVIISSADLSTQQLLENDFNKRDFNLNAFYCELTQEDKFEIFSFSDALGDRKRKIISFTNNEVNSFEQDPTRLFRLCNLLIKHPDYSLHKQVKEALISLRKVENGIPRWYTVFSDYVRLAQGNGDRLTYAIRKLFVRHSYKNINNALHTLGLLTPFTDNSKTAADDACSKIPPVTPESKLIMWLMANVLQRFENGKKDQMSPLNPFLYLYQIEHEHLAYAYSHGPKAQTLYPILKMPSIETLISKFKLPEKDVPSLFAHFRV
ncbi:hypothetical protein [Legionella shakespearei]|uniref:Poly(A) polymerase I n=1 Tax=Legionella shakespearei DSM 23087 TaxID=1122169 RepID=A0A0W0YQV3_9GAMM|nr:hypothetical protein [Legionella shakespearei]KTD59055.1 Poly(A) polymerase I [Legionella shakespearei DSM 23087]